MSDTKLRPEDLTSEERAIVEEMVTEYCPHISTEAWLETYEWALQRIEARRVLFAVAPEKVNTRCTHVGGLFSEEQRCIRESGHDGSHIYLNEKPAPEKAAKVSAFPVGNCVVCGELVAPYNKHAKYEGGYTCQRPQPAPPEHAKVECPNCGEMTEHNHSRYEGPGPDKWACQPAPPEPAAPINGSTPVGEYDPDMKPAAREMPEAVRDALSFIRSIDRNWNKTSDQIADALEREWRNLAQPLAVGMTLELGTVLNAAEGKGEGRG